MEDTRNIRKKEEFLAFIHEIEKGAIAHWLDIARALGVDKDTINEWKKLPEAKAAIKKGISNALNNMEEVGKKDWRMWESRLKMLGIVSKEKQDLSEFERTPVPIIPIYGGLAYGSLGGSDKDDPST